MPRRRSMPARTRFIRFPRAWRPRRSRASCRARTNSTPTAASPGPRRPTSRRSFPIAGWRGRASATRWSRSSTRWRTRSGASPTRCGLPIWCRPMRCRSTTSPTNISTAATTRKACAAWSPRSTFPRCAGARRRTATARCGSASASRFSASRRRTERRFITAGAFRWCRGSSRRWRGSPRTAASNCGSASSRTARAWKPRWRKWRTRCSASRSSASAWCTATPRSRPIRPAPGARAAW